MDMIKKRNHRRLLLNICLVLLTCTAVHSTYAQVGIGTTTPSGMLHIVSTTANALVIDPHGTSAGETGEIQFKELTANGSNHVGLKAPDNIASDAVFVLPSADGTNGQALVTDGSGNLSWASSSNGWWEELGRTTLTSAADVITVSGLAAKKYLKVIGYTMGANTELQFRFNGDAGSNYASRRSNDGSEGTFVSQNKTKLNSTGGSVASDCFVTMFIINESSDEKLILSEMTSVETTDGAATAPRRAEAATKWANTSAQITQVQAVNNSIGDFSIGSTVVVFGHD